jgi:hypothetical protein
MDFVSGVTWRSSQRGLVVCGAGGSSLLIEHAVIRTAISAPWSLVTPDRSPGAEIATMAAASTTCEDGS